MYYIYIDDCTRPDSVHRTKSLTVFTQSIAHAQLATIPSQRSFQECPNRYLSTQLLVPFNFLHSISFMWEVSWCETLSLCHGFGCHFCHCFYGNDTQFQWCFDGVSIVLRSPVVKVEGCIIEGLILLAVQVRYLNQQNWNRDIYI